MASNSAERRDRISILIQQIACAVVLRDEAALSEVRTGLGETLQLLADLNAPGTSAVTAAVIQALDALDAQDANGLNVAVERLASAWDERRDTPAAPPAPPQADAHEDELSTLQSDPEIATMFITEALDHLGSIESCVLQLETTPADTKLLNDVFRPFHTVKGNAGALGVVSVQELAHSVENLLDLARSGKHLIGRAGIDVVLRSVDLLTAMLRDLSRRLAGEPVADRRTERRRLIEDVEALIREGEPAAAAELTATAPVDLDAAAPSPAPAPEPAPGARRHDDGAGWVKVDTRKLDNLVDMVGELVTVQSIIQEDPALLKLVDERLGRNLAQLKRITSDLQRNAMSMRMVPIRQTFQKMGRLVRDLARKSGKQVDLVLSGEDTELDRRVVEDISDPLVHMVRNSMDHGLEMPAARTEHGKPAIGRLSLSAYHQGGNIVIAIADDGAGLNTERIHAKAVAQGLIDASATLSAAEIHHLIFEPGFSTAEKVTEISGRGVGMDVVRRNIDALRGRVEIQSETGRGTTFLIKLPLTLAIVEGLLLGVGPERFVLPTFSVCESLRPVPEHVHTVNGAPRMIRVRHNLLPLVSLAELFAVPGAVTEPTEATVVVIEDGGQRVALQVDRLLGKQEVVIKTLGESFAGVHGVAGGAILGDGRIGLILDAQGLVKLKDGAAAAA